MPCPRGAPTLLHAVRASAALVAIAMLPFACTVGPDYESPEIETPPVFSTSLEDRPDDPEAPNLDRWWTRFGDPILDELIAQAEAGSYDLKRAVAAIEQYRAGYGLAESQLYPSISLGAAYSRNRTNAAQLGGLAAPAPFNAWTYGLDLATWELDVFGKLRRSIEASRGEYQASVEEWRNVLVTLRAEVASAYVGLRVLQARRAVVAETVDLLERQLGIVAARRSAGTVTDLDLSESEATLALALAELPLVDAQVAQQLNALSVLVGEYPGDLGRRLAEPAPIPQLDAPIETGVPAQLILRRPDLRVAERELAARVASIGVAVAGLYPEVSLAGSIGIFATDFAGLGDIGNLTYRAGPQIVWNFFNGGLTRAQIAQAEAVADAAEIDYRAAVLEAVAEVETAASNVGYASTSLRRVDRAVTDARRGIALAIRQYEAGTIDLDRLIQYERTVLDLEDKRLQASGLLGQNVVELCRSLGGDWAETPLPEAAADAYPEPMPDSSSSPDPESVPAAAPAVARATKESAS
jgi:multidrug efflux system outer membrane protein